jgi:hydrogenase/urease accessory protein HupE
MPTQAVMKLVIVGVWHNRSIQQEGYNFLVLNSVAFVAVHIVGHDMKCMVARESD